jgi:hypothetical protein
MVTGWADFATPQAIGITLCAIVFLPLGGILLRQYLHARRDGDEAERSRREYVHQAGKFCNGEVVDVQAGLVVYSYQVAGVSYTASQDVSSLAAHLPPGSITPAGPVSVKYLRRNPANSIVLCENWSGLRTALTTGPGTGSGTGSGTSDAAGMRSP